MPMLPGAGCPLGQGAYQRGVSGARERRAGVNYDNQESAERERLALEQPP